jgi:S-formylglutathione hydrolase FrmB
VGFLVAGLVGADRYLDNFWVYRGFAPPRDPSYVTQPGRSVTVHVRSAAVGGRSQEVIVYLPPGYDAHPRRRYPVFYLLHGAPGAPAAFLETVRLGVDEDQLVTLGRMRPLILVMPFGSTGIFADKEWANGVTRGSAWETFLARDVVHAVDRRFRTIRSGSARALGGLSSGGYGALNIGLHHPGEFRVLESWSGYQRADDMASIFGTTLSTLRYNSPLDVLPRVAPALRRAHVYVWMYSDTGDHPRIRAQNAAFAAKLGAAGIGHRFFVARGGHTWQVWRGYGARALLAAASHVRG